MRFLLHRLFYYLFGVSFTPSIAFWKRVPMLRLLLPFIAGIVVQWYLPVSATFLCAAGFAVLSLSLAFSLLKQPIARFRWLWLQGLFLQLLFFIIGALAIWHSDVRTNSAWFGNYYQPGQKLVAVLEEPLVGKTASYKAIVSIKGIFQNGGLVKTTGKILLYFKKGGLPVGLGYGSQLVMQKPLQPIQNTGNPGAFDYRRYNLFAGITHQAYLTPGEYILLPQREQHGFQAFLFASREKIVSILRKYIPEKKEQGLAEALLIGYKDDLDKTLVQSYTNTGVVHIIAISGLHLALIYGLLMWLTKPLKGKRWIWWRLLIVVSCLWLFSLLAGAQPSVLRAAVTFTGIAFSTVLKRRTTIYNTIALAAFLLLAWNPFWLWDVGFQLSFLAVLSIIIFYQPIYNWLYNENKSIDFIWKLMAASLAAQILTLPISIYHFHQFPTLFLLANILAVPLSSLVVYGEILLCAMFFIPPVARFVAWLLSGMIKAMNSYVERLDTVSFALWNGLSVSIVQTILLYGFIIGVCYWLLNKAKPAALASLICLLGFIALRSYDFWRVNRQHKLIVYNVPKHQAVDVIDGRQATFIGDADLAQNDFLRNFHVQPSRVQDRLLPISFASSKAFRFYGHQVLLIDTSIKVVPSEQRAMIDLLVLSKNPRLYITALTAAYDIRQVVIDGSVPAWKAKLWQRDCDSLRIPCYNVVDKGAFVLQW